MYKFTFHLISDLQELKELATLNSLSKNIASLSSCKSYHYWTNIQWWWLFKQTLILFVRLHRKGYSQEFFFEGTTYPDREKENWQTWHFLQKGIFWTWSLWYLVTKDIKYCWNASILKYSWLDYCQWKNIYINLFFITRKLPWLKSLPKNNS